MQDFLAFLLCEIHDDLNRVQKKNKPKNNVIRDFNKKENLEDYSQYK